MKKTSGVFVAILVVGVAAVSFSALKGRFTKSSNGQRATTPQPTAPAQPTKILSTADTLLESLSNTAHKPAFLLSLSKGDESEENLIAYYITHTTDGNLNITRVTSPEAVETDSENITPENFSKKLVQDLKSNHVGKFVELSQTSNKNNVSARFSLFSDLQRAAIAITCLTHMLDRELLSVKEFSDNLVFIMDAFNQVGSPTDILTDAIDELTDRKNKNKDQGLGKIGNQPSLIFPVAIAANGHGRAAM